MDPADGRDLDQTEYGVVKASDTICSISTSFATFPFGFDKRPSKGGNVTTDLVANTSGQIPSPRIVPRAASDQRDRYDATEDVHWFYTKNTVHVSGVRSK